MLWVLLVALALAGLSDGLTTIALYMFVIPALPLIFAPTILYYALLMQVPRFIWKARLGRAPTALAAIAMLVIGNAPVPIVNGQLEARAAKAVADDMGAPPSMPNLASVALVQPDTKSCGDLCARLLASGVVDAVLVSDRVTDDFGAGLGRASVFSLGDRTACATAAGGTRGADEACIIRRETATGRADAIIVVGHTLKTARVHDDKDYAQRMDPFSLGPWAETSLSVWACESRCAIAMRRSEVEQKRLTAPLWLGVNGHGFGIQRSWARTEWKVNTIDLVALIGEIKGGDAAAKLKPARGSVRRSEPELEVAVSIESIEAMAEPRLRDPGVSQLVFGWSRQDAPLTPRQTSLLRRILLQPQTQTHFDWIKHPEAAEAMRDDLGGVLLHGRGPKYMTFAAIGSLSDRGMQRAAPEVLAWLKKPGVLTGSDIDDTFLIRLAELGPGLVEALATAWEPNSRTLRLYGGVNSALQIAVCRMGREARELLPLLERARTRIAEREPGPRDKYMDRYYEQFLPLTIDRVSTGSPGRSACVEAMLATERPPVRKEWLERIARMDR